MRAQQAARQAAEQDRQGGRGPAPSYQPPAGLSPMRQVNAPEPETGRPYLPLIVQPPSRRPAPRRRRTWRPCGKSMRPCRRSLPLVTPQGTRPDNLPGLIPTPANAGFANPAGNAQMVAQVLGNTLQRYTPSTGVGDWFNRYWPKITASSTGNLSTSPPWPGSNGRSVRCPRRPPCARAR